MSDMDRIQTRDSETVVTTLIGTPADTDVSTDIATVDTVVDSILADIATVDTVVDSILEDTAVIGSTGQGLTSLATQTSVDTVDTVVDSILEDTAIIGSTGQGLTSLATQTSVNTIDGYHDVPTKDASTDTQMRDVIGKKDDTEITDVGTTKSIIAYIKGLIQELDQRKVSHCAVDVTAGTNEETVVSISDKGVLTGIFQVTAGNSATLCTGSIRVVVDGTQILADTVFSSMFRNTDSAADAAVAYKQSGSLSFNHRFNTSLAVYHTASVTGVTTIVSYTTDD